MITAQDVKSGYGQKIEKPHTSVLPYLRAQTKTEEEIRAELQKEYEKIAGKIGADAIEKKEKAATGNKLDLSKNTKSEPEKATDKNDKAGLDQYDVARLEILRG